MCDYEKEYKISLQGIWKYLERRNHVQGEEDSMV